MTVFELIVLIVSLSIVLGVIGNYIYKKIKQLPTGECSYCHKGVKEMLKEYRKIYK